jgi:ABC-type transport system substrate-binding protein
VDAVLDGEPGMAETLVAREEEYYPDLDRALAKYPLDHRRVDQLLMELGFAKDGEGLYAERGSRLNVNLIPLGDYLREALVLADSWKRAGVEVPVRTLSATEQVDQEIASVYPAMIITQFQIANNPFPPFISQNIARPAVRWAGRNKGGYYDPEIDRLSDVFLTTLDRADRNRTAIAGMKLLSEQAAYFPLYYGYDAAARTASLEGPRGGRKITALWNLESWQWK